MSFRRTGMPPPGVAAASPPWAPIAAAMTLALPDAAATRATSSAALEPSSAALRVVTSISRISSTLANWLTVRTR